MSLLRFGSRVEQCDNPIAHCVSYHAAVLSHDTSHLRHVILKHLLCLFGCERLHRHGRVSDICKQNWNAPVHFSRGKELGIVDLLGIGAEVLGEYLLLGKQLWVSEVAGRDTRYGFDLNLPLPGEESLGLGFQIDHAIELSKMN